MNKVLQTIADMNFAKPADINSHAPLVQSGHHLKFEKAPEGYVVESHLCIPKPLSQYIKHAFGHSLVPVMNLTSLKS